MAFEQLFEMVKAAIETVNKASTEGDNPLSQQLESIRLIFFKAKELTGDVPGDSIDAQSIWRTIEPIFYFHDRVSKWLQEGEENSEEQRPGGSGNKLGDYLNQLVYRYLAVMVESSVKELRNALRAAKDRVDEEAAKSQSAEVYGEGAASDPSHSDLSKDHFSNVLNRPAGLVATVITNWVTQQVVDCWDDPRRNAEKTISEILKIMHHPAFPKKKTNIQRYMFDTVRRWWEENAAEGRESFRSKLTKDSVRSRNHENQFLTLKDFEGKQRGPAKFPGSRPEVRQAPNKRAAPISGMINDAITDINWVLGTLKKGMSDPRGAAGDVVKGAGHVTIDTVYLAYRVVTWAPRKVITLGSQLWPF